MDLKADLARLVRDGPIFSVRVSPRARKTALLGVDGAARAVMVAVAAPPEGGRANAELVRFLSRLLGTPVRLKAGGASKTKLVEVE